MASKLLNRLAEVVLLVGIDGSSGLKYKQNQSSTKIDTEDEIYQHAFQPHLLAAISSHCAIFPFHNPPRDESYPPMPEPETSQPTPMGFQRNRRNTLRYKMLQPGRRSNAGMSSNLLSPEEAVEGDNTSLRPGSGFNKARRMSRRLSRKMSVAAAMNVRRRDEGQNNRTTGELPLSNEVLNGLVPLCYPESIYLEENKKTTKVHYLVLTDIAGNRSFAVCVTYYKPYLILKSAESDLEGNEWDCLLWDRDGHPELGANQYFGYLPTCCVVVSKYPYYSLLKDVICRLVERMQESPTESQEKAKEFALQLTMTPVPPPGVVNIEFLLDNVTFVIHPADYANRTIIDLPLKVIFQRFPAEQILTLINCILTQQRVVFLCSNYPLLTIIMESLLLFIAPFQWHLPYVPLLTSEMLELLEAPGTFLMGCHSCHRSSVLLVEGLVIADIDNGDVSTCASVDLPCLPIEAGKIFLSGCQVFASNYDPTQIERTTPFNYETLKRMQTDYVQEQNRLITQISLQLMVNLFRDVISCIKPEQRFFNKEMFLETIPAEYKAFYDAVVHTDMFSTFLKDRMLQKHDQWQILEEKTRPTLSNKKDTNKSANALFKKRNSSLNALSSTSNMSQSLTSLNKATLTLPRFAPELHTIYYEKCTFNVDALKKGTKTAGVRAVCMYIHAMLKVGENKMIDALEEFHDLMAYDNKIFPRNHVAEMLSLLSSLDRKILEQKEFFKKAEEFHQLEDVVRQNLLDGTITMEAEALPEKALELEAFYDSIEILEIASNHDTIKRLFEALTLGLSQVIEPEQFALFYQSWQDVKMECLSLSVPGVQLDPNECFIRVSPITKTNLGTCRLGLTQKRLFFLAEGSQIQKEMMYLRDIQSIEKIMFSSLFSQVPALKISSKVKNTPVIASLKDARDTWHILINEMWSGKMIAEETRDAGSIQQAALNVLLVDALLRCGDDEIMGHNKDVMMAAQHLCYFSLRLEEGYDQLPEETKDVLQHRVDPNALEPERRAIESMVYTPGSRSDTYDEVSGPKLWCGMGSGKVQVFDASTWLLEREAVQAKDRIVALLHIGNQVWAASLDTTIYIIDTHTKTSDRTLVEHTSMVTDLALAKDLGLVFSCSIGGQILGWDMETLQKERSIEVSDVSALRTMSYSEGKLLCCSRQEVIVLNDDGILLERMQYTSALNGRLMSLDCLLVVPHQEIWVGCGREGTIVIWDVDSFAYKCVIKLECSGISKLVRIQDKIWVGSKDGLIFILNSVTHECKKVLKAHTDAVRCMCSASTRYVMSGAGSKEGKVAIWRTSAV